MKYPRPIHAGNWKCFVRKITRKNRAGMALILVLCAVALISVLAISLFSHVGNERVFSNVYAKGIQTNLLADSAVNLVIGQIRDATADGSLNWASQPGGIRTYDTAGEFVNGYKLYSSSNMVVKDENKFASDDYGNLSEWENKPGQYVDLNEPGYTYDNGAAIAHYPILNPALLGENIAGFKLADGSSGTPVPPADLGTSGASSTVKMPVEWLYVLKDGTLTAGTYQNGKIVFDKNPPSATNPIQARIAFWADDETSKVNINTASEGLFWDTPRANSRINKSNDTAGDYTTVGSVYNYSTSAGANPATDYERGLAFIQPANGEYNRYPGHPAMNCLSVLLPDSANDIAQGNPLSAKTMKDILAFAPVLQNQSGTLQGSQMGGYRVSSANPTGSTVTRDGSPLHTTVDDAAMVSSTTSSTPRSGAALFSPTQLEERGFLMTTTSRAPELNLFNRPRIAMWPVNNDAGSSYRTAYDNLVAVCSTITNRTEAGKSWPFLFKRSGAGENSGAYDPAKEWNITSNKDLYDYLTNSTTGLMYKKIPGFGGSFSSKYNKSGYSCNQIAVELLDYIRCTNIFDTTLEGSSYTTDSSAAITGDKGEYTIGLAETNPSSGGIASSRGLKLGLPGHGMVLPLLSPDGKNYRGLGRVPTISEVALHVICTGTYNKGTESMDMDKRLKERNKTLPADLKENEKCYQAMVHLSLYNPMPGPPNMVPRIYAKVTGLSSILIGDKQVFPATMDTGFASTPRNSGNSKKPPTLHGAGTWYGIDGAANMGFLPFVALATAPARNFDAVSNTPALEADSPESIDSADVNTNTTVNSLMSEPFIDNPSGTMRVSGKITITLHYGDDANGPVYQTLTVNLGNVTQKAAYPDLPIGARGQITPQALWSFNRKGIGSSATINDDNKSTTSYTGMLGRLAAINHYCTVAPVFKPRPDLYLIPYVNEGDSRLDTIVSVHAKSGDYRLSALALNGTISEASRFAKDSNAARGSDRLAHTLMMDSNFQAKAVTTSDPWGLNSDDSHYNITFNGGPNSTEPGSGNTLGANATFVDARNASYLFGSLAGTSVAYNVGALPNVPYSVNGTYQPSNVPAWWGDWDNGLASELDGAFGNMPDVGNVYQQAGVNANASYFNQPSCDVGINTLFFSPNRQVPSSGMFGSLPVGGTPWRTLLFRPEGTTPGTPGSTPGSAHPGAANPPDHLLMDWFWMPVVSPYVISDPFSTAGKINMNYQILPFHHIVRQTGLYSLLKAEKIMAIPNGDGDKYKVGGSTTAYRHSIDIGKTLQQFDDNYFRKGKIFKSATEICDQYLVPVGMNVSSYTSMNAFWNNYRLTGDNSKERPYANIYPRLTTRSNTFRVHYRVQMLQKVPGTAANVFVDPSGSAFGAKDQVMSESRGSCVVERYLEHDDPRFGKTINPMTDTLNKAYKFRIVGVESFDR